MNDDDEGAEAQIRKIYADAYRSYLRTLRDGLNGLDIDAIDLPAIPDQPYPPAWYSWGCITLPPVGTYCVAYSWGRTGPSR